MLCAKLGDRLPGRLTIPEQIASDKSPYYAALEAADASDEQGKLDVSAMEGLLTTYLGRQLSGVFSDAGALAEPVDQEKRLH